MNAHQIVRLVLPMILTPFLPMPPMPHALLIIHFHSHLLLPPQFSRPCRSPDGSPAIPALPSEWSPSLASRILHNPNSPLPAPGRADTSTRTPDGRGGTGRTWSAAYSATSSLHDHQEQDQGKAERGEEEVTYRSPRLSHRTRLRAGDRARRLILPSAGEQPPSPLPHYHLALTPPAPIDPPMLVGLDQSTPRNMSTLASVHRRPPFFLFPPIDPAILAVSVVQRRAEPLSRVVRPPLLAISRRRSSDNLANPRGSCGPRSFLLPDDLASLLR